MPALHRASAMPAEGDPRKAAAPEQLEGGRGCFDMAGLRAAVEALEGRLDISWQLGQLLPRYSSTNLSVGGEPSEGLSFVTRLSHTMAE